MPRTLAELRDVTQNIMPIHYDEFFTEEEFQEFQEDISQTLVSQFSIAKERYSREKLGLLMVYIMGKEKVGIEGLSKISPERKKELGTEFMKFARENVIRQDEPTEEKNQKLVEWSKMIMDGTDVLLSHPLPSIDLEHPENTPHENIRSTFALNALGAFYGNASFLNKMRDTPEMIRVVGQDRFLNVYKTLKFSSIAFMSTFGDIFNPKTSHMTIARHLVTHYRDQIKTMMEKPLSETLDTHTELNSLAYGFNIHSTFFGEVQSISSVNVDPAMPEIAREVEIPLTYDEMLEGIGDNVPNVIVENLEVFGNITAVFENEIQSKKEQMEEVF